MSDPVPVGYADFYHPTGVKARLPLAGSAAQAFAAVSEALAAGWLVQMPGLEAGEQFEEIGYCVRKEKDSNGEITPVIDCYSTNDGYTHSFITVYLNTDDQVKDFERASGLTLKHMPLYEGRDKIQRGENRRLDEKVKKCTPFRLVWKANPKYDPKEAEAAKVGGKMYTVPKKRFVRFEGAVPGKAAVAQPAMNGKPDEAIDQERFKMWCAMLQGDPKVDEVNQALPGLAKMNRATARACWEATKEHATAAGWVFDQTEKAFFVPAGAERDEVIPF